MCCLQLCWSSWSISTTSFLKHLYRCSLDMEGMNYWICECQWGCFYKILSGSIGILGEWPHSFAVIWCITIQYLSITYLCITIQFLIYYGMKEVSTEYSRTFFGKWCFIYNLVYQHFFHLSYFVVDGPRLINVEWKEEFRPANFFFHPSYFSSLSVLNHLYLIHIVDKSSDFAFRQNFGWNPDSETN